MGCLMFNNIMGTRIRYLRKKANLTQIELANILNVSNTTLSQYESGQRIPGDDIKIKISDYFNVSIDYLLGNSEQRQTPTAVPISPSSALQEIEKILNDADIPQSEKDDLFQRFTQIYFLSKEKNEKK